MKILVISESFNNGGLETQIKTYYENLPQNIQMVFAFGKYSKKIILENAKIYTNFHFSYSDTIKEFCEDVDNLVKIINEEKIDVIHVHPYYSFFASFFASQLTHKKLIYTYHGASSFNFLNTTISSILFYYSIESNCIANILSVNSEGIDCLKNLGFKNCNLLVNPVDLKKFPVANIQNNGKWAIISRIDEDKIEEIKQILLKMNNYKIKSIDVYGDGSSLDELEKFIKNCNLSKRVFLKGYASNIFNVVNNKYNGIIGIGRVVIESIVMGYPTIIIGFNKINGFIDTNMFEILKENNFVNKKLEIENREIPKCDELREITNKARNIFNIDKIILEYITQIENSTSIFYKNIEELYKEIEKLSENNEINCCYFHKERLIYNLLQKYIKNLCLKSTTLNLFINANIVYEIYDNLTMNITKIGGNYD